MILCDAGVLFCLVDRTQPQHNAYRDAVTRLAKPFVTTWSCLTEAMYLDISTPMTLEELQKQALKLPISDRHQLIFSFVGT
ncbi:hypothetical protein [Floridanema evergladense]|uniref:PIN domain-containing protein n=1 Tax=Floridaenema evergladense BLCC-F167 TaxID=3153639 RepID=A0ABV4WPV2_9CYAN